MIHLPCLGVAADPSVEGARAACPVCPQPNTSLSKQRCLGPVGGQDRRVFDITIFTPGFTCTPGFTFLFDSINQGRTLTTQRVLWWEQDDG